MKPTAPVQSAARSTGAVDRAVIRVYDEVRAEAPESGVVAVRDWVLP
jgi:hypothetical protein